MPDHFLLQWEEHTSSVLSAFSALRRNSKLVDVTLAADGRSLEAHKMVLCANSSYFEELLSASPCKHPIVYMKDVGFDNLSAIVEFMYNGVVYVGRNQLPDVIKVGNSLQVRGIAGVNFNTLCEAVGSESASVSAASEVSAGHDQVMTPTVPCDRVKRRRLDDDPARVPSTADSVETPVSVETALNSPAVSLPAVSCPPVVVSSGCGAPASSCTDTLSSPSTASCQPLDYCELKMEPDNCPASSTAPARESMANSSTPPADPGSLPATLPATHDPESPSGGERKVALKAVRCHSLDSDTTTGHHANQRQAWLPTGSSYLQKSRRGGGRQLQRQTRVKRDGSEVTSAASAPTLSPDSHLLSPLTPVEPVPSSDCSPGLYLTVAPMPPRQPGPPTSRHLSTVAQAPAARALIKQGSAPAPGSAFQQHQQLMLAASGSPAQLQKQHSTPASLQLGSSGTTYYMVAASNAASIPPTATVSSSASYVPMVVEQRSGPLPQIMLTSADNSSPVPLGSSVEDAAVGAPSGCPAVSRSHTPSLREGPAVSCSHCWNTEYSQGRTIRRKTKYMCRDCAVSLCIVPCFQEYHEMSKQETSNDQCSDSPTTRLTPSKKLLPKIGSI